MTTMDLVSNLDTIRHIKPEESNTSRPVLRLGEGETSELSYRWTLSDGLGLGLGNR